MSPEFPNPYRDVSAELATTVNLGKCATCPLIAERTATMQARVDHEVLRAEAMVTRTADEAILQERTRELLQAIGFNVALPTAEQARERVDRLDRTVQTHIQEVGARVVICAGVTSQQGCGLE